MDAVHNPAILRMSEADLVETIVALAQFHGWRVTHFRPARTEHGWRTALQGHAGFVDLVLARNGVVLHVECKTVRGKTTLDQRLWGEALGPTYRLWRPTDLDAIREELR